MLSYRSTVAGEGKIRAISRKISGRSSATFNLRTIQLFIPSETKNVSFIRRELQQLGLRLLVNVLRHDMSANIVSMFCFDIINQLEVEVNCMCSGFLSSSLIYNG